MAVVKPKLFTALALAGYLYSSGLNAQGRAISDDQVDQAALLQMDQFLNDPAARAAAGKADPKAAQANNFLEKFPPYAQQELISIVSVIMHESKGGAVKHQQAFAAGGALAAKSSFSPAVQARVDALMRRLAEDPAFNTPENMQMMKSFLPSFLGTAASSG